MPPERFPPDSPDEWINRARSNLIQAKSVQPGVYLEDLCFNAQQAVEKALKALLIYRNVRFPYVHDLAELVHILEDNNERLPDEIKEAVKLTDYAVVVRYPGITEPVTPDEYSEAVAMASKAVRWVEDRFKTKEGES